MQQCCLSFLYEFNCDISHLPWEENVVADALSCLDPGKPLISMPSPPDPSSPQSADALVSEVLEMSEVLEVLEVSEVSDLLVSSLPPAPPPLVPGISYSEMSVL